MSITKRRFFAGFMKSQEKWLNKMSDNGYRLIKTGKLSYEFEECTPGKYRYAIDYVGDKTLKELEDYKAFLESLGFNVFYKNINLDYSLFKLTIRPWADKSGIVSTNRTTYNKELLIVEKENDGRDFMLHTEKNDLIEYYQRLCNPSYYLVFLMLVLAILAWPFVVPTTILILLAILFAIPIIRAKLMIKEVKKQHNTEE